MKYIIYLLSVIIILGLNLGLFESLQIKGQIPNLLLLLTIYFAVEKKDFDFFFVAFVSGLLLDFYSSAFFGGYLLAFLITSLFLYLLVNQFLVLKINFKSLSLIILGSLVLTNLCLWFYGLVAYKLSLAVDYTSFKTFLAAFIPQLFYDLLLLYPMYLLYSILRRWVDSLSLRRRGVVR